MFFSAEEKLVNSVLALYLTTALSLYLKPRKRTRQAWISIDSGLFIACFALIMYFSGEEKLVSSVLALYLTKALAASGYIKASE